MIHADPSQWELMHMPRYMLHIGIPASPSARLHVSFVIRPAYHSTITTLCGAAEWSS